VARRSEVPLLEHDGRFVQGSGAIVDYIADSLGGTKLTAGDPAERARAVELEKTLDKVFGRGVQQVLYSVLLKDRRTVVDLWSSGGPRWTAAFYALAFPMVASAVKRMYKTGDAEGSRRRSSASARRSTSSTPCFPAAVFRRRHAEPCRHHGRGAVGTVCRVPEHRVKWPAMPAELAEFEAKPARQADLESRVAYVSRPPQARAS
jgi:glutathione S-transferase